MTTASIKRDLLESLKDKEFREALILENVYIGVSFQLRALREQRELSQAAVGRMVIPRMAQERISILEDPNSDTKPTLNTLLRMAHAFDVGLDVRFVPLAMVLDRAVNTDTSELRVNSCESDMEAVGMQIEFELGREKDRVKMIEATQEGRREHTTPSNSPWNTVPTVPLPAWTNVFSVNRKETKPQSKKNQLAGGQQMGVA